MGSRMLTRMKTVLKRGDKRASISGPPAATSSSAAAPKKSEPTPAESSKKAIPAGAKKISRAQLHEERARKLGERFGLDIKPDEWHSTEGDALRVEKPIRMRVHRACHKCQHTFGTAKECINCKHTRCRDCPRYPPKRTEAELAASRTKRAALLKERADNPPLTVDWNVHSAKKTPLIKARKAGGQDLIYKKQRQRVRRNCCQCQHLYVAGDKSCPGCSHTRCTDCPRDPAAKKYYPFGYPGDVWGPNTTPVHRCHECKTLFTPGVADGTECLTCAHPKCAECPRPKPRKVEPEPDPELLKSIEARLIQLKLG